MASSPDLLFRALSDPTRRHLFERLAQQGELSVAMLTDGSGVSQPMVSRHLSLLRDAGLVRVRRTGRESRYSPEPHGLAPLAGWMRHYEAFWEKRFDALADVLGRIDE